MNEHVLGSFQSFFFSTFTFRYCHCTALSEAQFRMSLVACYEVILSLTLAQNNSASCCCRLSICIADFLQMLCIIRTLLFRFAFLSFCPHLLRGALCLVGLFCVHLPFPMCSSENDGAGEAWVSGIEETWSSVDIQGGMPSAARISCVLHVGSVTCFSAFCCSCHELSSYSFG